MKYKLKLVPNKKQIIKENKLNSNEILYLLIHGLIDVAKQNNIQSSYINILERILENNKNKLKSLTSSSGVKVVKEDI